jgi:hypothetical protein
MTAQIQSDVETRLVRAALVGARTRHLNCCSAVVAVMVLAATGAAQAATQIAVKATPAFEQVPGTGGGTYFAWSRGSPARLLIQSGPGQSAFQVNTRNHAWAGSIDGTTLVYQRARESTPISG